MMSKDQIAIESAKNELSVMSKRLLAALVGSLAVLLVLDSVLLLIGLDVGLWSTRSVVQTAYHVIEGLIMAAMGAAIFLLVVKMLRGGIASNAPFSLEQSRRMFALGMLLIATALLGTLVAILFSSGWDADMLGAGGLVGIQLKVIHIDILFIVAAIVSFYLSYLFKLGTFLQWLYDETI